MSRKVDGQALGEADRILGLFGGDPADVTLFDDSSLQQTLDMATIIRRSRTPAATQGLFRGVMLNTHAAGDSRESAWSPYEGNSADTMIPPYDAGGAGQPGNAIAKSFDVWLFDAYVRRVSGSGTVEAAMSMQNVRQGFGIDNLGAAVSSNQPTFFADWDLIHPVVNSQVFLMNSVSGAINFRINRRLPRRSESATRVQVFFESTSSAAAAYELNFLFGVFPAGLGQDAFG